MLRAHLHTTGASVLRHARALLEQRPVEHNLLLGICNELGDQPAAAGTPSPYLLTVDRHLDGVREPVAVAVQMAPYYMVLSHAPDEALPVILADRESRGLELNGVTATESMAQAFADLWTRTRGGTSTVVMRQGIYQATAVTPPPDVPGRMRRATRDDLPFLPDWGLAFARDARLPPHEHERLRHLVASLVDKQTLYLWEHGEPVSMAAYQARTADGARVSFVYTPSERRGNGYAAAVTAALTQLLLDEGCRYCCLYTDLSNPVSNKVYQRVGYQLVVNSAMIRIDAAAPRPLL